MISSVGVPAIVLMCLCIGALLGMALRAALPKDHLSPDSGDVIKLATGLMATLAALVLSLLISSANNAHNVVESEYKGSLATVVVLDHYLAAYGPEAQEPRDLIRHGLIQRFQRTWPQEDFGPKELSNEVTIYAVVQQLLRLSPRGDRQTWLHTQALQLLGSLAQVHWRMISEEVGSPLPRPFLFVLTSWTTLIFLSFGLFARPNPTVIVAMFAAALAVSGAIFLIQELSSPFRGLMQLSSAPAHAALAAISR
jgi:hypothetical protein